MIKIYTSVIKVTVAEDEPKPFFFPLRNWTMLAELCTVIMGPFGTCTLTIVSCQRLGRGAGARANEMLTGCSGAWILAAC